MSGSRGSSLSWASTSSGNPSPSVSAVYGSLVTHRWTGWPLAGLNTTCQPRRSSASDSPSPSESAWGPTGAVPTNVARAGSVRCPPANPGAARAFPARSAADTTVSWYVSSFCGSVVSSTAVWASSANFAPVTRRTPASALKVSWPIE